MASIDRAFSVEADWERKPSEYRHGDISGVAVDSQDRVYLLARHDARVLIYDSAGKFLRAFGQDVFSAKPHGLAIGRGDEVFVVDEYDQTVRKFSCEGDLLMTIGVSGALSDTGVDWNIGRSKERLASIKRGGPPFNHPTNLCTASNGDLFVSDGYGNARIHQFSADGGLVRSWGEPGSGPGEFRVPHAVAVISDERLLVADRENDRLQVFTLDGRFLEAWTNVQRPSGIAVDRQGLVYVSELCWYPGDYSWTRGDIAVKQAGRVTILDPHGTVMGRLGGVGGGPCEPGKFGAPHAIAVDSRGNVYVGEVIETFLSPREQVPSSCHTVQKFVRHGVA